MRYIKPGSGESVLPSTVSAMGGAGFFALAVSSNGESIATASGDYIFVYPEVSIWIPSVGFPIPESPYTMNFEFQNIICTKKQCICRSNSWENRKMETHSTRGEGKRRKKYQTNFRGTIQYLNFFGKNNEYLIGIGPCIFVLYDLMSAFTEPLLSFDMRQLGIDGYKWDEQFILSYSILDINRKCVYFADYDGLLSSIQFVISIRSSVPTHYRILFDEKGEWWAMDCPNVIGIIPLPLLDEKYKYPQLNEDTKKCASNDVGCVAFLESGIFLEIGGKTFGLDGNFSENSESGGVINCGIRSNGVELEEMAKCDELAPQSYVEDPTSQGDYEIDNLPPCESRPSERNTNEDCCDLSDSNGPQHHKENCMLQTPSDLSRETDSSGQILGRNIMKSHQNVELSAKSNFCSSASDFSLHIPSFGTLSRSISKESNAKKRGNVNSLHKNDFYFPFCLLRCMDGSLNPEMLQELHRMSHENIVFKYRKDFIFVTWVPFNKIIMLKLTIVNNVHLTPNLKFSDPPIFRKIWIDKPFSTPLCDLILAGVFSGKITSFVAKSDGDLFSIMAMDRFYLLKYSYHTTQEKALKYIGRMRLDGLEEYEMYTIVYEEETCDETSTLELKYAHYDPVQKLRYTIACFSQGEDDGYFAACYTNSSNNWRLNIFDLKSQSSVEAIRLILDISKCKGLTNMFWVPNKNKIAVLSGFCNEFCILQPKSCRNWAQLIPNFCAIEKNIEFVEAEDEFDCIESKEEPSDPCETDQTKPPTKVSRYQNQRKQKYPFYHVGYSVIGEEWRTEYSKPMGQTFDKESIIHSEEALNIYKSRLKLASQENSL